MLIAASIKYKFLCMPLQNPDSDYQSNPCQCPLLGFYMPSFPKNPRPFMFLFFFFVLEVNSFLCEREDAPSHSWALYPNMWLTGPCLELLAYCAESVFRYVYLTRL